MPPARRRRPISSLGRLTIAVERGASAYRGFFAENLPDHCLPALFTVHMVNVSDKPAPHEFYSTALWQPR